VSPVETIADVALTIYIWMATVLVILFLFLIARFYELKSGQRSNYRLFLIPVALATLATARYVTGSDDFVGDMLVDGTSALAGAMLVFVGGALLRLMTEGRR